MASKYPYGPNPEQESLAYLDKLTDGGKKKLTRPPETYSSLIRDPAIEKFGWIRENSDRYFKFKPRSIFYAVMAGIVVPGTIYYTLKYLQRQKDIKAGRPPRDFL